MKTLIIAFLTIFTFANSSFSNTIRDKDGNVYNIINIGGQLWTKENLNTSFYRNGDSIPQVTDATQWANLKTGAWCYYQSNTSNGIVYGKLYNWYAVNDPRGLAPLGLEIPYEQEMNNLGQYLGGISVAGGKMKETGTSHWANSNTGATNSSVFTALPGGIRNSNGVFASMSQLGTWWTATKSLNGPVSYDLSYNSQALSISTAGSQVNGYSVRCIIRPQVLNLFIYDLAVSPNAIKENLPPGTEVGVFSASDTMPGDYLTYELIQGVGSTDNNLFSISGNKLITAQILDTYSMQAPAKGGNDYLHYIRVAVTNQTTGEIFEKELTIQVLPFCPQPKPSFVVNPVTSSNSNKSFVFTNTSLVTASPYIWNFGDGSPQKNAYSTSHYYTNPGNYTVKLIAANIYGCNDSISKVITICPDVSTYNPFQDTTRVLSLTTILNAGVGYSIYQWSNGSHSNTITAKSSGLYQVEVTNNDGCIYKDSTFLILSRANIVNSDTTICIGQTVNLRAQTSIGPYKFVTTYNTHDYYLDTIQRKWTDARDTSLEYGMNLWKIDDLAENINVFNSLPFNSNINASYWTGLHQDKTDPSYAEPAGGWKWMDGSSLSFSNWLNGEPNNAFGSPSGIIGEDFMAIKWVGVYFDKWNDLPNDVSISGYDAYGVAESTHRTYLWSTGETTSSITVNPTQTTTYYLTVSDQYGSTIDSVIISSQKESFNPLQDTTLICGSESFLTAPTGYDSYTWNNGGTTNIIKATTSGFYKVVASKNGCAVSDSTYLSIVQANILQGDTTICKGSSITLSISSSFSGATPTTKSELPANLQNGLVAYFPFNGNSNDESGFGVNATNYNSVLTEDRFGNSNSAYSLNGFNNYLETGLIPQLNGASNFSIGLWVKVKDNNYFDTKFPAGAPQFLISRELDNSFEHFSMIFGGDQYTGQLKIGSTHYYATSPGKYSIAPPIWRHIVLTGGSGKMKLYVDGELSKEEVFPGVFGNSPKGILIGRHQKADYPYYVFGDIDDVMMYNRTLNASEIASIFQAQRTVNWSTGSTSNSITVSPTETTKYFVTVSDGITSCQDSVLVTVKNEAPIISYEGATTFCSGGSVVLTSSSATGNQWYKNGIAIINANAQTYTATQSGSYTVRVIENEIEGDISDSVIVTSFALPTKPIISATGELEFCDGGNVSLGSREISGNQWFKDGAPIIGGVGQFYSVTTSGSYSLRVTDINTCISQMSDVTIVVVDALPTKPVISSSGSLEFCDGGSVMMSAPVSSGYRWYRDGVVMSGVVGGVYTASVGGMYSVSVTNENGCVSEMSNMTAVLVNALPSAPVLSVEGVTEFCEGGSVSLVSSSVGGGNQWYRDGLLLTGAVGTVYTASVRGEYSVRVRDVNGCESGVSSSVVVLVNSLPAAPVVSVVGVTEFCEGGSVVLNSTIASGYKWYRDGVLISSAISSSLSVTQSGLYSVEVSDANGCKSMLSDGKQVSVNPIPSTPTISAGGSTTFCSGGSVVLTSSSATGNQWYLGGSVINTNGTSQTYTATASGNYTVKVTSSGCESPSSSATAVTVNPIPSTPTISTGSTTTFCSGGSVVLTSSSATGNQWYLGGVAINTSGTGQTYTATSSGNYTVRVTSNGCESPSSSATAVTVNPIPSTPTISAGGSTTFCSGSSIVMTSSSATGNQWYLGGVAINTNGTGQTYTATTGGTYSVKVVYIGCQSQASSGTLITVNSNPLASFTVNNTNQVLSGNSFVFTNTSTGGGSYLWNFGNGVTSTTQNATYSYPTAGNYTVNLKVTSVLGCVSNSAQNVSVTTPVVKSNLYPNTVTCQSYLANASNLTSLCYTTSKGKVSAITPGTFSYFATITAPATSFTIDVTQTVSLTAFKLFGVQSSSAKLLSTTCGTFITGNSPSSGQSQFKVTGAVVGRSYIISIIYETKSSIGATSTNAEIPIYTFKSKIGTTTLANSTSTIKMYPNNCQGITTARMPSLGGLIGSSAGMDLTNQENRISLSAYPNPSHNVFEIKVNGTDLNKVGILSVYNNLGQLIETKKGVRPGNIFQLGGKFIKGIYFVDYLQNGLRSHIKIIKQ